MDVPNYWKTNLGEIEDTVKDVKNGEVNVYKSAGGRNIFMVEYGKKNIYERTANLSSAAGSGDIGCYADKTQPNVKPCLMIVGAMHGAEFEGTAAILNLIQIMETGRDFLKEENAALKQALNGVNLLLIPCLNPDGRARVPYRSVLGLSFERFRYYAQGTWKNGSLAGWPDCKRVHPIKEAAGFLGAYYNDDGINLMHDDFFNPMAAETKLLLDIADEYVPDAAILLHGGTNSENTLLQPKCVPLYYKEQVYKLSLELKKLCKQNGLSCRIKDIDKEDSKDKFIFDAVSAFTIKCGGLCAAYETNQGLDYGELILGYEDIYKHHILLFELMARYVKKLNEGRKAEQPHCRNKK